MTEHKPNECPACVAGLWVPNCTWTATYPEAEPVAYLDPVRADEAEARETAALKRAEVAEARVDQLTDELALTRDTLTHRTRALNETGATNDTLRAKIAAVRKLAEKWRAGYGYQDDSTLAMEVCGDRILAAIDPGPVS